MNLKHGIFLAFALMCTFFAFSATPPTITPKKVIVAKKNDKKSAKASEAKKKNTAPFCRICCTYMVTDADGNVFNATSCAGWFLTSCETAAERACEKARDALGDLVQ